MPEYMPGPDTTYQAYGRPWANVSNAPFREYKSVVHEGGIATPMIVHWPAGIERDGELERQPGHIVDLMATAVDLGNATYPDTVEDLSEKHPERLEKMTQQWDSAARHFNAVPWPYGGECGMEEDK